MDPLAYLGIAVAIFIMAGRLLWLLGTEEEPPGWDNDPPAAEPALGCELWTSVTHPLGRHERCGKPIAGVRTDTFGSVVLACAEHADVEAEA